MSTERIEEGAPLIEDLHAAEDFQPLLFDEPGEGDKSEPSEEAFGAEETPPPPAKETDTPAATEVANDPVYDIPGVGQIKASDIRGLHAQSAVYQNIQQEQADTKAERERIEALANDYSEAIEIQKLLDYKDVREAFQRTLGELFSQGDGINPVPDGKASEFAQALKGTTAEKTDLDPATQAKIQEMENQLATIQSREDSLRVDQMFSGYAEKYPEIVNQEFKDRATDAAIAAYANQPDNLGMREFELVVQRELLGAIQSKAANAAAMVEALKDQPPGTRVVTGHGTRPAATPKPKDATKMEWSELEAEGAAEFFVEEGTG
jgi:ATP:corrinoid adenosyltransferase